MPKTVAIVGRPNVGKSTLFNRLVGRRAALVDNRPGVTRDWREGTARLGPAIFRVFDTAGVEDAVGEGLGTRIQDQTDAAIDKADLTLLVIDGKTGVTALDKHIARRLRRRGDPVILVVNKAEGFASAPVVMEAYGLGLGDPIPISAEHGEGLAELYDALTNSVPELDSGELSPAEKTGALRLAVIGRPNVGKSTLVNRLLGDTRVLTGPEAGITRDAIAVAWQWNGSPVELVDTAGMRRRARVSSAIEKLSAADSARAIRSCHVAALMVDATGPMDKQDFTIAKEVADAGRAAVIAANKWDLVPHEDAVLRQLREQLNASLTQIRDLPVCPISALSGAGVEQLMRAVMSAIDVWSTRLPTSALNRWMEDVLAHHPPPLDKGRRIKIRYLTQVRSRPPTFALFVNRPKGLSQTYKRYLANSLRKDFNLAGTPIRFLLRGGENPFAKS